MDFGKKYNLLTILGPTAGGKTSVAARIADRLDGEVISADSRQLYKGMDIGTGKDYADYWVEGRQVPVHLIDIIDPGYQYNVFEYQQDFFRVFDDILLRNKWPVMCGGSGMYLESVLDAYQLIRVPVNPELRESLEEKTMEELEEILASYKSLHNKSDSDTRKRAVRAIEIADYQMHHDLSSLKFPEIHSCIIGIYYSRAEQRRRISQRLYQRLDEGMVDEVDRLLKGGLTPEQLEYYGLEYKWITFFLTGRINYEEMCQKLETAIHQFAKRQMTWFRRMEKKGMPIQWLSGDLPMEEKVNFIAERLSVST